MLFILPTNIEEADVTMRVIIPADQGQWLVQGQDPENAELAWRLWCLCRPGICDACNAPYHWNLRLLTVHGSYHLTWKMILLQVTDPGLLLQQIVCMLLLTNLQFISNFLHEPFPNYLGKSLYEKNYFGSISKVRSSENNLMWGRHSCVISMIRL